VLLCFLRVHGSHVNEIIRSSDGGVGHFDILTASSFASSFLRARLFPSACAPLFSDKLTADTDVVLIIFSRANIVNCGGGHDTDKIPRYS
jgi:hypothetical protein